MVLIGWARGGSEATQGVSEKLHCPTLGHPISCVMVLAERDATPGLDDAWQAHER
jgi:hypothetical protein